MLYLMRHTIFALACLTVLTAGVPARADDPTSLLNKKELQATQQQPNLVVTAIAPPMADEGTRQFGSQYRSIVPMEIKSDMPGIIRTWDPDAHPGNGNHMTPEGMACANDDDCELPMGCFNRADSGKIPEKLCAIPPNQ